ncbi:VIT1/CCC1 transporter family protein [Candidatus Curtissbacteria bacterium]|nr:VIT1/CCC1 transporter family protein [Candidatus Curtissbacteria bacterium]
MAASDIAAREPEHPNAGGFIRDIVFGANDGVVTAVGFLIGFAGAVSNQQTIIIAGVMQIIAGGASMALGNYLAVKSQREFHDQMERVERWEMENKPEKEKDEIREIYTDMGFDHETVEILTKKVTADKELWLKVMMRDELGFAQQENENPIFSGLVIGFFFLLGGLPPLLPFIFIHPVTLALMCSFVAAVLVKVLIGYVRWVLNKGSLSRNITETVLIGVTAAAIGLGSSLVLKALGITGVTP